jgi:hypothetical protein
MEINEEFFKQKPAWKKIKYNLILIITGGSP